MKEIRKVLVIKLGDLTEFVLSLAAMKRIRAAHPRAQITLLTTPPFNALAKASPYFNTVNTTGAAAPRPMAAAIKGEKFDRIYDLDGTAHTASIYRWMWPFRPEWSIPPKDKDETVHLLERHAAQLQAAGVWPEAPTQAGSAPPPDLSWIQPQAETRRVAGAVAPRPYVVMIPGGDDDKRWPENFFGETAAKFRQAGFDIVIIGGPEHSALARAIQRYDAKARDLTGRTDYAQLAILGAKAALSIGGDNGLTQLIAASGSPMLALYSGASDPLTDGPRGHVSFLQANPLSNLSVQQVLRTAASIVFLQPGLAPDGAK